MNPTIKNHIKLLAERFEHHVQFDRTTMILSNSKNTIRIEEYKKSHLDISYNINGSSIKTERVPVNRTYDLIFRILTRYEVEAVQFSIQTPIQLKEWMDEEYSKGDSVLDLQRTISEEKSDHAILGGNRLEAEYYKGVIILMDDLLWMPCNVVSFELNPH